MSTMQEFHDSVDSITKARVEANLLHGSEEDEIGDFRSPEVIAAAERGDLIYLDKSPRPIKRRVEFEGVLTGFDITNTPKEDDIVFASLRFSTRMSDMPTLTRFLNYCQTTKGYEDLRGNKFTLTIDEKE